MEYVTGQDYMYVTGNGEQRTVTLGAIVNGRDGTVKNHATGRKMTVPLGKLIALPANSTDNTKNTNGASAPESETTMPPKRTTTKATGTRKATTPKATTATKAATTKADTPKLPPIPPVTATPASVGNGTAETVSVGGVDIPTLPPVPMPTASPETTNTKTDNTNNGKAINMADFFKPSGIAFDFCDIHNDGNEDEILREGEAFRIPGTPIPNGPVMTVCAETVWDAIDDIRRHWKLLRTDDGFLDAWITEQGENLPERPADEEFEEYDGTEGHEETPAPPAPAPTLPAPPKAPSPARAAVQADLTGQATVSTTPPKAKATGGGTKGQATPGPSRIPRTLHPSVSKHAKAWAGANGIRNGKGEVYTELTPGKLPAEALKGWLDSNPTEHEAFVTSWDPR